MPYLLHINSNATFFVDHSGYGVSLHKMRGDIIVDDFKLFNHIIDRSEAKDWPQAKLEWSFDCFYEDEEGGSCLCGHNNIVKTYDLINNKTGERISLGSSCINKLLPNLSDKLRKGILAVFENPTKSLDIAFINYFYKVGAIDHGEHLYYIAGIEKNKVPEKKLNHRKAINQKVMRFLLHIEQNLLNY